MPAARVIQVQTATSFSDVPTRAMICYSRCECGILFQTPRLVDDEIIAYYSSGRYRREIDATQVEIDVDEQARADDLVRFLKRQGLTSFSHLDIGCSRGYFLRETRDKLRAEPIAGIELLGDYTVSGIPVMPTLNLLTNKFGLVSAIHVLEHCINPRAELQSWIERIEPRGYLLLEVPGANSKGGPLHFSHLFYFPGDTLRRIIESSGLVVVAVETWPHTRILVQR